MELDFAGKKLIVIGGTSGIGKAVASLVLGNGGSALLVGRREAKTREAILELRSRGEVSGWTVDITSGAERATLIDHPECRAHGRNLACECRRCFRSEAVSRTHRTRL
jgi:NAD(P)-dependent dehydrogenase (short-subunit alcohol dehydrogenase family)